MKISRKRQWCDKVEWPKPDTKAGAHGRENFSMRLVESMRNDPF